MKAEELWAEFCSKKGTVMCNYCSFSIITAVKRGL